MVPALELSLPQCLTPPACAEPALKLLAGVTEGRIQTKVGSRAVWVGVSSVREAASQTLKTIQQPNFTVSPDTPLRLLKANPC